MSRFKISRREVLKGILGGAVVSVALPPLEAMFNANGTAYAGGGAFPVRFVSVCFGNGVVPSRWKPTTTGVNWELTEELAPLANVKSYCNIPTGYDIKLFDRITHHEGMAGMFSGYPFTEQVGLFSKFGGPSIDQVVANAVGSQTFLPSLELGVSKRVSKNEGPTMQYMSHKGTDQPLPPIYNPRTAFQTIFNGDALDDRVRLNRLNVLDAVLADANALKTRVGTADRQRLDAHLESIFELQEQINAIPPVCGNPTEPTETNDDVGGKEPMTDVAKAQIDLLVLALKCDITRVSSLMLTGGVGFTVYSDLGHIEEQHNELSHGWPSTEQKLHETIVWNVERFAYLAEQLMATPEGAGNVLDNSVLIMGTDCSKGWTHSIDDMPVVVCGGGSGALTNPGVHFASTNGNLSDVLLAATKAAVPSLTSIGGAEGMSTTPASWLYTGP